MPLTSKEQDTLIRLLAKSTNDPKVQSIGSLAREHLTMAIEQISQIAKLSPMLDIRLKAANSLVELSMLNTIDDDYTGDTDALVALSDLPQAEQRGHALKMFAQGRIGRKDLDTVLKILDSGQALQVMFLTQQNKYLEGLLEDKHTKKPRVIDGGDEEPLFAGIAAPSWQNKKTTTVAQ